MYKKVTTTKIWQFVSDGISQQYLQSFSHRLKTDEVFAYNELRPVFHRFMTRVPLPVCPVEWRVQQQHKVVFLLSCSSDCCSVPQ